MKKPTVDMLLSAYTQGIFPMAHTELDDEIYWYAPDPRAIIELDGFHVSKRLGQTVRNGPFEIRFNTCFEEVMLACAAPRATQEETWISSGIVDVYTELHHMGFAHSVETWLDDKLVGGLYGVAIHGLFAGESMFHTARDASKVALVALVTRMRQQNMMLLDIQFMTDHLAKFGAIEIPKTEYEKRLALALERQVYFDDAS